MSSERFKSWIMAVCGLLLAGSPLAALEFNLIPNGDFDDGADPIAGWSTLSPEFSFMGTIEEDDDDCVGSLAGSVDNFSEEKDGEATSAQFVACATDIVVGESYRLTGRFRFPSNMVNEARMYFRFKFSPEPNCTDELTGGANSDYIEHENMNALEYASIDLGPAVAPPGADSARIDIVLQKEEALDDVVYLYFDKIYFTQADYIFAEDFEFDSSACRWSQELGLEP